MNKRFRGGLSPPLFVFVSLIIALILLPSLFIVTKLFEPATDNWIHIKTYLLENYIVNSLILVISTGLIAGSLGVFFAWFLSHYKWRYGKVIEILLFLPMAIPPYIAGYVYGGIFTSFGTFDRFMMSIGLNTIRIDILSMGGAIFIFSLCLMPYVMLVTKAFYERLPKNIEESSRILGKGSVKTFFFKLFCL